MPQIQSSIFFLSLAILLFSVPSLAFAKDAQEIFTDGLDDANSAAQRGSLIVPSASYDVFAKTIITNVINWILGLTGALALAALIWGGFIYVTSLGNEKRIEQAKQIIIWAIVGLAIIFLAFVIINFVAGILGAGTGAGSNIEVTNMIISHFFLELKPRIINL